MGRWLSKDPSKNSEFFPEGSSLYAYVGNNPIGYTDRFGRDREVWDEVGPFSLPPLMYHQWLAVDTWDENGQKSGQVGLSVTMGPGGTDYRVEPQSQTMSRSFPGTPPMMLEHIPSTPEEDNALIKQWLNWQGDPASAPGYFDWPTCAKASQKMKNYKGPAFRASVNLRNPND